MEIYKVTNKLNGKCYIGKTIYNLEERKKGHLKVRYTRNYPFYNAINKYGLESFIWETIYICNDENELNKMEMYFIQELNTLHPNGYNLSLGGDGQSGFKHSEESRRKISKNNWMRGLPKERHPMYGKHHTNEAKEKMSRARKGVSTGPHSEETKAKLSKSKLGKLNPMYGKIPGNARKVMCVETGIVYETIKIAQDITGICKANISSVCRGVRKKAGGYTWKFVD